MHRYLYLWLMLGPTARALLACSAPAVADFAQDREQSIVYGEDSRKDVYEISDEQVRTLALAGTAALMNAGAVTCSPDGRADLYAEPLGASLNLCESEAFVAQPSAAHCSGVLVDDDLILTAGHCVEEADSCAEQTWAFDYAMPGPTEWPELNCAELRRCRSVPLRVKETRSTGEWQDYAFVELDRPVSDVRHPVTIARLGVVEGEQVPVVGYPAGLPAKVDMEAKVLDTRARYLDHFTLSSDTSIGSSGSGVFNTQGELLGVLARGRPDFVYDAERSCQVSIRVPEPPAGASAEQANYVTPAIRALCATGFPSVRLCGSEATPSNADEASATALRCSVVFGKHRNGAAPSVSVLLLALAARLRRRWR